MRNFSREIEVKKGLNIEIMTSSCDVRLFKGSEEKVTIDYGCESESSDFNPEEFFDINYDVNSNHLKIRELPAEDRAAVKEAKLKIGLSGAEQINIINENGNVSIKDLTGKFKFHNDNGSMKISRCTGSLILEDGNGFVKLKHFGGKVDITTMNGGVDITSGSGTFAVETQNGQIRVLDSSHTLGEVSSVNGSIFYDLPSQDKGRIKIGSINGKIQLNISDELSFSLKAKNENGSFHIGLEDNYDTEKEDHSRLIKMVRGAGKFEIDLRNINGSINLLRKRLSHKHFKFNMFSDQEDWSNFMSNTFKGFENIPDDKLRSKIQLKVMKKMQKMGFDPDRFTEKYRNRYRHNSDDETELNDSANKGSGDVRPVNTVSGLPKKDEPKSENSEIDKDLEKKILKMLEEGVILPEEAERLLEAIKGE